MGNGATVSSNNISHSSQLFGEMERRCSNGYYFNEKDEYLKALEVCISAELLDCLELLVKGAGDLRLAKPVHIAGRLGKLESLELLLSAGLPGDTADSGGRTPLHLCCQNTSSEAALCSTLLAIRFPRSLKKLDYAGQSPGHLAVMSRNCHALTAIKQQGFNIATIVNTQGLSVLDLAKQRNDVETISILSGGTINVSQALTPSSSSKADVSQERIMAVWEKFFENAFMRAGVPLSDEEEEEEEVAEAKYTRQYSNNSQKQSQQRRSSSKSLTSSKKLHIPSQVHVEPEDSMLWIVCIDRDCGQYFLTHRQTLTTQWLHAYLEELYYTRDLPFLNETAETVAWWPYPRTLWQVSAYGWMSYYDRDENESYWFNTVTGVYESYLPLGEDEASDTIIESNLLYHDEDILWVTANQDFVLSWVIVLCSNSEAQEDDRSYYYLNTSTNDSSWSPPLQWQRIMDSWNGWYLCCEEDNPNQQFW